MNKNWRKSIFTAFLMAAAMLATQASAAPKWETVNGKARLIVRLRYVCSSWLYLRFLNSDQASTSAVPSSLIRDTNTAKCAEFAALATADAQAAFDRSDLPVSFVQSSEIEAGTYNSSANLYLLRFYNVTNDNFSGEAARLAAINKGLMPGLTVNKITGMRYVSDGPSCQYNCSGYWTSSTAYIAPRDYTLTDPYMTDLLAWTDSHPAYLPPVGELSVTILVKPFQLPGQKAVGINKALIDWRSKISGETLQPVPDLTPDNYLRRAGVIGVLYDYPRQTVAHELGHVLGALHQRNSWSTGESFYRSAGFVDASGTQIRPGGAYTYYQVKNINGKPGSPSLPPTLTCVNTVMINTVNSDCIAPVELLNKYHSFSFYSTNNILSFSSPHAIVPEYGRSIGSSMADNRLVIGETLRYLAGGNCFPGATLPPLACQ